MKMTSIKMKKMLEARFQREEWKTSFNRDKDTFRVEWKDSKQGVNISLPGTISKWEERGEEALNDLEEHISEALRIMNEEQHLVGKEKHIVPVIRAASFPTETKDGKELVYEDHTAETRIYYALDLGKSYRLIDKSMVTEEGWTEDRLKEVAKFNVRALPTTMKQDVVAGNTFTFISTNDGYDSSRILNDALLEEMKANSEGELAVAVPHSDVLIFADITNASGYDILAQMTFKFFAEGRVPVTSLPFLYDQKELEPIFVLAQKKPTTENDE
ncbi:hypothetical protein N781_09155 [Pontibacillus halophilus JSM 076056 = DSM 19796]|uniref:UPF0354 protein N781_09155 n=1 Tax=Pontibacillus halophilus JSM 076056 = DSM 19796 TaxID=1385510 RepID=A0A0A5GDX9_9BACI|nr:DUF1444 domain-containing protein [Pontibacillus halophilus]KGX89408.1 hypothetical protein N781_09155 [Pontibacillus halophilus JSM 076056 = DSM 19796]